MNDKKVYKDIVQQFNLSVGDRIWLSSDVTKLAFVVQAETGKRFDAGLLLQCFMEAVGTEGTLMLPTFNYEFSNKGKYDYLNSRGTTGALGNVALKKCGFRRTKYPIHSFAVWGKEAELLCEMNNLNSFGEDSPFGYCEKNNVIQLMLGTDWTSMTFVHYVEARCKVPYRFTKKFTGVYILPDGTEEKRSYDYEARYLDIGTTECFDKIWKILEENRITKKYTYKKIIDSYTVELGKSFSLISKDILENQCRNLYDFNVDREKLFEGYGKRV